MLNMCYFPFICCSTIDIFLSVSGRLLHDKSLQPEVRVRILNVLSAAALKDDVILLLHQDRREHVLMNYAHDVDRLSTEEQESLALFVSSYILLTDEICT